MYLMCKSSSVSIDSLAKKNVERRCFELVTAQLHAEVIRDYRTNTTDVQPWLREKHFAY